MSAGSKRLLLLGGGHAQLQVLRALVATPLEGWQVLLVTPYPRLLYSGMVPGWIAGHYALEECAIDTAQLAERAGATLALTTGAALDLTAREVHCADGRSFAYDLLSIDTGPQPALGDLPGAAEHALPVRPIEGLAAAWPTFLERARGQQAPFRIVVLGAGAAGVELALALRQRSNAEGWAPAQITLAGDAAEPMAGAPHSLRTHIDRALAAHGIDWRGGRRAVGVHPGELLLGDSGEGGEGGNGISLPFDLCLVATGAAAPGWAAASGLATDARGFIRVDGSLRSESHAEVFAAGDVAALRDPRPKSGVFAVRAGPVLAASLRAAATGKTPEPWSPQPRALALVSTGERHAIANWGCISIAGNWVWRWKDWIDRRFVRGFQAKDKP